MSEKYSRISPTCFLGMVVSNLGGHRPCSSICCGGWRKTSGCLCLILLINIIFAFLVEQDPEQSVTKSKAWPLVQPSLSQQALGHILSSHLPTVLHLGFLLQLFKIKPRILGALLHRTTLDTGKVWRWSLATTRGQGLPLWQLILQERACSKRISTMTNLLKFHVLYQPLPLIVPSMYKLT